MNKWIYTIVMVFALVVLLVVTGNHIGSVSATGNYNVNGKVTICHRNDDAKDPYVQETPDASGDVDGHDGHDGPVATSLTVAQTLKDTHTEWGDIIPPFDYQTYDVVGSHQEIDTYICPSNASSYTSLDSTKACKEKINKVWYYADKIPTYKTVDDYAWVTHTYAGKNWTTDGQTVWNNSCGSPAPTATPTTDPCANNACVTITPTVTITTTPTPTSEATPSATPTQAPTATPTPGSSNNGGSNNSSNNNSSNNSSSNAPVQAVLGASTMADTGTFTQNLMNIVMILGMISLVAGATKYAKENK